MTSKVEILKLTLERHERTVAEKKAELTELSQELASAIEKDYWIEQVAAQITRQVEEWKQAKKEYETLNAIIKFLERGAE